MIALNTFYLESDHHKKALCRFLSIILKYLEASVSLLVYLPYFLLDFKLFNEKDCDFFLENNKHSVKTLNGCLTLICVYNAYEWPTHGGKETMEKFWNPYWSTLRIFIMTFLFFALFQSSRGPLLPQCWLLWTPFFSHHWRIKSGSWYFQPLPWSYLLNKRFLFIILFLFVSNQVYPVPLGQGESCICMCSLIGYLVCLY